MAAATTLAPAIVEIAGLTKVYGEGASQVSRSGRG